jgi:hypothetical protein
MAGLPGPSSSSVLSPCATPKKESTGPSVKAETVFSPTAVVAGSGESPPGDGAHPGNYYKHKDETSDHNEAIEPCVD